MAVPERMEARSARCHLEGLQTHLRWPFTHPDRAAQLLHRRRLVGLHVGGIHGVSLQPGQQQTDPYAGRPQPGGLL